MPERTLSPLENFHRMMRRERPDRLPLDLPITPPIADLIEQHTGTRDAQQAFDLDVRGVGVGFRDDPERWRAAFREIGFDLPANHTIGFAGVTHLVPPLETLGKAYHLREMIHPLSAVTDVAQLERLPWPDTTAREAYVHIPGQVREIHDAGYVAVGHMACTTFEFSWYVRGMDCLFEDLIVGNGIGDWLLDWFTERAIRASAEYALAGADVIVLGDDVGTQRGMMMSVDFWRRHLKGRLKAVIDAIRAAQTGTTYVFYHSDGDIRPIVPELVEIGVDILNPVQPECMPTDEIVPQYRDRLAFWGLVGTQTTMPFGTPGDVRGVVAGLARHVRDGAAIVVAPTHVLEPDVPWENIEALVEAVKHTAL